MVTAGIFLIIKFNILLENINYLFIKPSYIIVFIGILTSFISSYMALQQRDNKKITAYSTCSQ